MIVFTGLCPSSVERDLIPMLPYALKTGAIEFTNYKYLLESFVNRECLNKIKLCNLTSFIYRIIHVTVQLQNVILYHNLVDREIMHSKLSLNELMKTIIEITDMIDEIITPLN